MTQLPKKLQEARDERPRESSYDAFECVFIEIGFDFCYALLAPEIKKLVLALSEIEQLDVTGYEDEIAAKALLQWREFVGEK